MTVPWVTLYEEDGLIVRAQFNDVTREFAFQVAIAGQPWHMLRLEAPAALAFFHGLKGAWRL